MNVYVGPYVKAKVPIKESIYYDPWCTKCDKMRGDTPFCAECGGKIGPKSRTSKEPVPHWSLPSLNVLSYAVTNEDGNNDVAYYIYTIGNGETDFNERERDEKKLRKYWYPGYLSMGHRHAEDLQNIVIKEEIAWLRARCQQEIINIGKMFGEENVSFEWGVVTTWR